MKKEDLICFIVPTSEPDSLKRLLLSSLDNIQNIKEYTKFSIVFQPPYTDQDIDDVVSVFKEKDICLEYQFKEYSYESGRTPLLKIRNDCSKLCPNSLFYALLDDDMTFLPPTELKSIGLQYLNLVYRLLTDSKISVGKIGNSSPFEYSDKVFAYDNINDLSTGRGTIVKNYDKMLVPERVENLYSAGEDVFSILYRLIEHNTSLIAVSNGLCSHYENRKIIEKQHYGWSKRNCEEGSAVKYMKDNYLGRLSEINTNIKCTDFIFNLDDLKNKINTLISQGGLIKW